VATDHGTEFTSKFFEEMLDLADIKHHVVYPKVHSKNQLGIVERMNRTLKRLLYIEAGIEEDLEGDWDPNKRSLKPEELKRLLPGAMRKYNYENNHRTLNEFWNRDVKQDAKKEKIVTPSMMLVGDATQMFHNWRQKILNKRVEGYKDWMRVLDQGGTKYTWKKRYQNFPSRGIPKGRLEKMGGVNRLDPKYITGRYSYINSATGRRKTGNSYSVWKDDTVFLPYDFKNKQIAPQDEITIDDTLEYFA